MGGIDSEMPRKNHLVRAHKRPLAKKREFEDT
jgi:hypothetical protein